MTKTTTDNTDAKNEIAEIFQLYHRASYLALKYSITAPITCIGNLLDLFLLGYPKRFIDVSPLMTNIHFYWEATREKEKMVEGSTFFNKGFGGLLRAISTLLITIPLEIVSPVIGAIFTALHLILSPIVGSLAKIVENNCCGSDDASCQLGRV